MQLELRVHTRRSGPGDEAGYLKFGKQTFSTSSYSSAFITVQTLGCLKNFKPSPTRQEDSSGNQCSLYLWASAGLQLVFRLFLGWPPRCCVRPLPQKWPDIEMKYHRRQKQEMHWHCRRSCQGQFCLEFLMFPNALHKDSRLKVWAPGSRRPNVVAFAKCLQALTSSRPQGLRSM